MGVFIYRPKEEMSITPMNTPIESSIPVGRVAVHAGPNVSAQFVTDFFNDAVVGESNLFPIEAFGLGSSISTLRCEHNPNNEFQIMCSQLGMFQVFNSAEAAYQCLLELAMGPEDTIMGLDIKVSTPSEVYWEVSVHYSFEWNVPLAGDYVHAFVLLAGQDQVPAILDIFEPERINVFFEVDIEDGASIDAAERRIAMTQITRPGRDADIVDGAFEVVDVWGSIHIPN